VFKYNLNKWIRIIVPIVFLILFIGIIIYVRHFKEHPGLEIFFTMFFTIVSAVPITYMWKTHGNKIDAQNTFNFMFEQLEMNIRKYYVCKDTLLNSTSPPYLLQISTHALSCIEIWEGNQDKYYEIFLKHPYLPNELKSMIFLSFMELYMEMRLVLHKINELARFIDDSNSSSEKNGEQSPITKLRLCEVNQAFIDAKKQAEEVAHNNLSDCAGVIYSFKNIFFGKPFVSQNIKIATKSKALNLAYKEMMGIEEKEPSEPKAN
jgi:hypothetical protein